MKKKLFSLLVALCATTTMFADMVTGSCGGNLRWSYDTNTRILSITGTGRMNNYNYVEDKSGNYFLNRPWESYSQEIDSLYIQEGVASIGDNAFAELFPLTSVSIPNSVTSIGGGAFYGCRLTSVSIPNSVTSIGGGAFYGCRLTSVSIPNSVTSIGDGAFYGCTRLTSATIGNSVTSIGGYAFYGCTRLTSATIGNSVTSIGGYAFKECEGLTKVNYMGDAKGWNSIDFDNVGYANPICYSRNLYLNNVLLTDLVFPDGVTEISNAFAEDTCITSVSIPNSVTSIGGYAFYGCTGLTSVTIPNSVTSIGSYAFAWCKGLTSVTIPNSVTSIGEWTFYECEGLTSVTIPNSVTSIGEEAFYDCTGLTSATIGNSVTSIGEKAFFGCTNIETVMFGKNVQNIGSYAFYGCKNIYEMTVKATKVPNVYESSSFYGVSENAELHVPAESVKKYKIHPVWGLFNVITAIPCVVTLYCDNVMGAVSGAGSYQANEQVTITATPNIGYRFRNWSDGITTNPRTIVVVGDTTLTAEFEEMATTEHTVSIVVDAEQNGAVQMVLTAVPDDGYRFINWSDGNTDNPRTIMVTEDMTLTAKFEATSVEAIEEVADNQPATTQKIVHDGQVYILRDGKTYTVVGQRAIDK